MASTQTLGRVVSRTGPAVAGDAERVLDGRRSAALLVIGCGVAVLTFFIVHAVASPPFHLGRELELRATVQTYLQTGALLVKPAGTGSPYTQIPGAQGLVPAAWDDDPGIYVAASIMTRVLGFTDPHRGLRVFIAVLAAMPWIWIPLTMGRAFASFRAGLASLGGLALWVLMVFPDRRPFGTDYTAFAVPNGVPVYAQYGAASAWLVLVVTLLFLIWSRTNKSSAVTLVLLALTAGIGAGVAHGMRSQSGLVVLGAAAVLIMSLSQTVAVRTLAVAITVLLTLGTVAGYTYALNTQRSHVTGIEIAQLPTSHNTWHPLYLGLAYTGPGLEPNPFGIVWDDSFAWSRARAVDPNVLINSTEYDRIIRDLYWQIVRAHPLLVGWMYLLKAASTAYQEGRLFIAPAAIFGLVLTVGRRRPRLGRVGSVLALATLPGIVYGFAPPTLVMPYRYYFLELTASLGIVLLVGCSWLAVQDVRPLLSRVRHLT